MKQGIAIPIDSNLIRPLREAQNEFIQVLLSNFKIDKDDKGFVLNVEFDNDTLAVWLREGKKFIKQQISLDLIFHYQNELDDLLIRNLKKKWEHNNPRFPFRFGNGGVLPVINYREKDYYCFFYRDIWPVGWNISNGGAESVSELLDPLAIVEREFREELIIIDPFHKCKYVFDWNEGKRPDHPDFIIAKQVWNEVFKRSETFKGRDFQKLEDRHLPLKWINGPDCVNIKFGDKESVEVSGCFLNINAEDFGIEIDRVAKISVSPDSIFCDGELSNGIPVNQIVGLFEVNKFNSDFKNNKNEFFPDLTFWDGQEMTKKDFNSVVNQFLNYVVAKGIKRSESRQIWDKLPNKYNLCPVTRNLVNRYLNSEREENHKIKKQSDLIIKKYQKKHNVFLSFPSEDLKLARKVFNFLQDNGFNVFFSDETLHQANFGNEIDKALKGAKSMVLVGSKTELLSKPYVRYEWESFHNDILEKRKPRKTPLITFTKNPNMNTLPRPLIYRQVIDYSQVSLIESLTKLKKFLS